MSIMKVIFSSTFKNVIHDKYVDTSSANTNYEHVMASTSISNDSEETHEVDAQSFNSARIPTFITSQSSLYTFLLFLCAFT